MGPIHFWSSAMGLTLFSFAVGHGALTFFSLEFELHRSHGANKYCPVPKVGLSGQLYSIRGHSAFHLHSREAKTAPHLAK